MSDQINVTPEFVVSGRAIFTVSNGDGKHFTYMVKKAGRNAQYPDSWFLYALHGPNNIDDNDYTYVGRVFPGVNRCVLRRTAKSKFPGTTHIWKVGEWALKVIWQVTRQGYQIPAGYSIKHIGQCGACGRALTTPASLDTGMGPECAARLGVEWAERNTRQPALPVDDPNSRRTKQNPGPNRRKGPRTLHIIDEHTSARDYTLACADLRSFFDPSKHHGGW